MAKKYNTEMYNLDAVIAVGYRVNSRKVTKENIELTNWLSVLNDMNQENS